MTKSLLVAGLAFSSALPTPQQASSTTSSKPRPTGVAVAGGGFITMTAMMGLARALEEVDAWNNVTHVGGVSGGSWFATQFTFSEGFSEDVLGKSGMSVSQVVGKWGEGYELRMQAAIEHAILNDMSFNAGKPSRTCVAGRDIQSAIDRVLNELMTVLDWPSSNWHPYVQELLSSYDATMGHAKMDAARFGPMRHAQLITGLSLPPDSWDNTGTKDTTLDLGLPKSAQAFDAFPLAYVSHTNGTGNDAGGWQLTSEAHLTLTQGAGAKKVHAPLILPEAPTVAQISGGSSSAAGFLGSKQMTMNVVSSILGSMNLRPTVRTSIKNAIRACLPLGFQNTSSPVLDDPPNALPAPSFRYIDGGFTETTSLGWTLSQMQMDCASPASAYDCSMGFSSMVLSAGEATLSHLSLSTIFANDDNIVGEVVPSPSAAFSGDAPSNRLFAEAFPEPSEWIAYSDYTTTGKDGTTKHAISKYWKGVVTTVDNPYYKLRAGDKVELLIFAAETPAANAVIAPGRGAGALFHRVYGPYAEQQAIDGKRVLDQVLH